MSAAIDGKNILINLDQHIKQYFINSSFEYLLGYLSILRSRHPDHDIKITATFQTPLDLQPFAAVIDSIADVSQLPPNRITVITRNRRFSHPRATIRLLDDSDYFQFARSVVAETSALDFEYEPDPRLFGALFGRCSYPRMILAHHLETQYPDQSLVTFLASYEHLRDNLWGLQEFDQYLEWAKTRSNPVDSANPECHRGSLNFPENIRSWPSIWARYNIEIVVETDYHNSWDWTEKTWKCLASGKPFLLMSGHRALEIMRTMGFKTFHPWLDERYDLEPDAYRRLEMIQKEIDRLANLDTAQIKSIVDALNNIAKHNKIWALEKYV